ncbi:hypothetical protein GMJAKD_01095 [Candidatus Electrothrix aarhusensis]
MMFVASGRSGSEFFCNLGNMLSLETGTCKLIFTGKATAVAPGDNGRTVGRTAADFVHRHLPLEGIGQSA